MIRWLRGRSGGLDDAPRRWVWLLVSFLLWIIWQWIFAPPVDLGDWM
jgi:hypothetical protein